MVVPSSVRAWRNCWQVMHTMDDRLGRNVAVVIVVQCGCFGVVAMRSAPLCQY